MCVHVNNVNMTSQMRPEKYGRHENSNTSENITLNSSLNTRRFSHQIYSQTVHSLGFSVGELRTITLWPGETIAVRSHHDSASNFAHLPWICAHPPTRSTLAYGPVWATTECHKNERACLQVVVAQVQVTIAVARDLKLQVLTVLRSWPGSHQVFIDYAF